MAKVSNVPYGMTIGTSNNASANKFPARLYTDAKAMGITTLRAQVPWKKIETVQGVYDFTVYDDFVTNAKANGFRTYLTIAQAPDFWLTQSFSGNTFPDPTGTANIASAIISQYGANLDILEIGNEDYDPNGGDQAYAATIAVASPAIRAANPNVLIPAAALLKKSISHYNSWLATFYANNCHLLVDCLTDHYYPITTNPYPYHPSQGSGADVPSFDQMITTIADYGPNHGYPRLPLWITEGNWPTNPTPARSAVVSQFDQWQNLLYCYEKCRLSNGRVQAFYPFTLLYTNEPGGVYDGDSLVQPSGPLMAYYGIAGEIAKYPLWKEYGKFMVHR